MVRPYLLGGHAAPEHRTASVAFLQFTGLDRMIADHGAEDAAGRLDELVRMVQDASDRYEVCFLDSDISADGGKIRLSAGAPRVVGDDEERMLLALRQIIEADPPLPVQAGVNRGPVFTGEVGPDYRRWYAVMGDTVNLAARVMGKAPAGHLYATRDVLRHARVRFSQTEVGPFTVKGKARPVQAWDVGSPMRSAGEQAARPALPLVGRRVASSSAWTRRLRTRGAARARCSSWSARPAAGSRACSPRPGSSARAWRCCAPPARWSRARRRTSRGASCSRQLLGVEWDDPSRARAGAARGRGPRQPAGAAPVAAADRDRGRRARCRRPPRSTQLAPEARAAKLREVVLRFLGRALVVPTIVEVEHAPLDGRRVGRAVRGAGRELESSSWIVLVTRQDAPGGPSLPDGAQARIELGPLLAEDVRTLALATPEAAQVPPHVVELAVERSGGSPEFLLDLLAAAAAGDRDELPESVGAATMARIDALDPRDRRGRASRRRARDQLPPAPPGRRAGGGRCRCPKTASGTGCRACSRARRTGTCASSGPRSRRSPTRACRSSSAASCTWRSGLRLEHDAGS